MHNLLKCTIFATDLPLTFILTALKVEIKQNYYLKP